jgi:hypothetical protein
VPLIERRARTRALGVPLALVLTAALSACEDDSAPSDGDGSKALYAVGSEHAVCTPTDSETAFTEGFDTFANRGPGQITIDKVDWPTTGDLEVDSIRVFQRAPGDNFATVGIWGGLPEDGLRGPYRKAWDRAVPAEGANLDETDGDENYLIFVVGLTGTNGTGGPLTVHYTDADGHEGTATSLVELTVAEQCSKS